MPLCHLLQAQYIHSITYQHPPLLSAYAITLLYSAIQIICAQLGKWKLKVDDVIQCDYTAQLHTWTCQS